ncbi:MAG TPA: helix-turn-helix domain-containing protein [Arachnia sp.]|nr:helix-turn-helix domain-containing protein [Arachnia sp.]
MRHWQDGPAQPDPDFHLHIPGVELRDRLHRFEHMVFWQVRGSTLFTCDGQPVELREDEVLWMPAGTAHSLSMRPNSVLFPYWFTAESTATTLTGISVVRIHPAEKIYFLALHQSQVSLLNPQTNLQRQVLSILERRSLPAGDLPMPGSPAAAAVANALLFNPGDDRRIVDWAAEVHTSGRSLERAFLSETGLTLREWRLRARMHAAARLLRLGASVASVSRRVGYESPNSFSRAFRGFYGQSPTEHARHGDLIGSVARA